MRQHLAAYQSNNEGIEMAKVDSITPEILRQLLRYEPSTGALYWLERPESMFSHKRYQQSWNTRYAGKQGFTADIGGYRYGAVLGVNLYAHRVAWALHYGDWPSDEIDHINGDKSDNSAENLREASHSENMRNRGAQANNSAGGLKGVTFDKRKGKWMSQIRLDRKTYFLGYFLSKDEAHRAYAGAVVSFHGDFARAV